MCAKLKNVSKNLTNSGPSNFGSDLGFTKNEIFSKILHEKIFLTFWSEDGQMVRRSYEDLCKKNFSNNWRIFI